MQQAVAGLWRFCVCNAGTLSETRSSSVPLRLFEMPQDRKASIIDVFHSCFFLLFASIAPTENAKDLCTERMFKNDPENYFFLKQGGGRLLEDGRLLGQLR